ncbi:MAG: 3-keto-5-aminohexanoate cleavage protein [Proteobacteria bacterium]|nr:3-keto-5-aminohexanoate cleavage protein [Pseudomonadota bacterium]
MNDKVWLEVALNGGWGRKLQPLIPASVEEIIEEGVACANAGAAIIHFHSTIPGTGEWVEDADFYIRAIEGLRERTDAIVYPTLALTGAAEERYAPTLALCERGLMEWGVVDPGTVNITHRSQVQADRNGFIYPNPDDHIRMGLELAQHYDWHPSYAIYEPGFMRAGAWWAERYPTLPTPIYRLMLPDHFTFGLPFEDWALDAYRKLHSMCAPDAPLMVAAFGNEPEPMIPTILDAGCHLRVGLEDAPAGSKRGNLELVESAVAEIEKTGRTVATPTEVRAHLTSVQSA